jgi:hypothetical protein
LDTDFAELLADHDRAVAAGIVDNLLGRRHESAPHDANAGLLIVVDKLTSDGMVRKRAKPLAGKTPSSTAAPVLLVVPPTWMNSIN